MMNGNALSQFLTMNVLIRADASVRIGSGHVMRCLTLASELRKNGAIVGFVCRDWAGNLFHTIEQQGFPVYQLLPLLSELPHSDTDYASWLGVLVDGYGSQRVVQTLFAYQYR